VSAAGRGIERRRRGVKTVLCYGDSNTWGYEPASGERFPEDVRWPGVLARELGSGFKVIEEGLNARTTVRDDPVEEHKNGKDYLRPCLESHRPLDLVIVALGVNDLKARFFASASDAADGAGVLVSIAQRSGAGPDGSPPAVLLVAPPQVGSLTDLAEMFAGAEEKSKEVARQYRRVAEKHGCELLDAGELVRSSDRDGIHLEVDEHRKMGEAVAARVKEMLGG
jgi:lysophospholipase L1-like esterase